MGWIGTMDRVMDTLKAVGAAKDDEGRFMLRAPGVGVVSFMGDASADAETVVGDEVQYFKDGDWHLLVPRIVGGLHGVTVL